MRYTWIDVAKGICIFCVILSHTQNTPLLYRCIFEPYFLTLFFFLSGLVFKIGSFKDTIYYCISRVLWPYLINSVIIIIARMQWIRLLKVSDYNGLIAYFQDWGEKTILGGVFWFLACLFVVQVLATIIVKCTKGNNLIMILIIILCLSSIYTISGQDIAPWSSNTAIFALGYFLLGTLCKNGSVLYKLSKIKPYWGWCAFLLYLAIIILISRIRNIPTSFDLHTHVLSPEPLYVSLSLIGILCISLLSITIKQCNILQNLGKNSLTIYMYHGYGILITNTIFSFLNVDYYIKNNYITSIGASIMITYISYIIALLITRKFPILIGKGEIMNKLKQSIRCTS